jgi:hypothetical protein
MKNRETKKTKQGIGFERDPAVDNFSEYFALPLMVLQVKGFLGWEGKKKEEA